MVVLMSKFLLNLSNSRRPDLKAHVLLKHPHLADMAHTFSPPLSTKEGKAYTCPVATCKSGYTRKADLRRHLAMKHNQTD